jgi:OmpA-OmpF porin, OOP family
MRKMLLCAAVAASLTVTSFASHAASGDQFFVSGNVGQSDYHGSTYGDSKKTAYSGMLGYRWNLEQTFYIGPEIGYIDLGKLSQNVFDDSFEHETATARARGPMLGVNARWELPRQFYFTAHTGVSRLKTTYGVQYASDPGFGNFSEKFSADQRSNAWYGGVGFGYSINANFDIGLTYDNYDIRNSQIHALQTNVSVFGINAEYHF